MCVTVQVSPTKLFGTPFSQMRVANYLQMIRGGFNDHHLAKGGGWAAPNGYASHRCQGGQVTPIFFF